MPNLPTPSNPASLGRSFAGRQTPTGNLKVSLLGLLVFVAGASSPIMLNVVGELYVSEVVLPLIAIPLVIFGGAWRDLGRRPFLIMSALLYLMLMGYILSDLIVGSRPEQYLRGWARVLVTFSDFVAAYVLLRKDRLTLWWMVLGMGVGGICYLAYNGVPITRWKIGYGEPTALVAVTLGCLLPGRLKALPILALGPVSMWLDYRSFAAICLCVGFYTWHTSAGGTRSVAMNRRGSTLRVAAVATIAILAISVLLNATEDKDSLDRRKQSDAGRLASMEIGLIAIERSPFIGHGSWSEDPELARLMRKLMTEYARGTQVLVPASNYFGAHSQILGAWVEGGLLAAIFFVYLIYRISDIGRWIVLRRPSDALSAAIAFVLLLGLWDVMMSPFAGLHRERLGLAAAVVVVCEIHRRQSSPAALSAKLRQSGTLGARLSRNSAALGASGHQDGRLPADST